MDRARAQQKLNLGYGKVGKKLGRYFTVHRPMTVNNPLGVGNVIGQQWAYFDTKSDMSVVRVSRPGESIYYVACDATNVQQGDYFVIGDLIYFIGTMQDLLPPEAIQCNEVLSFFRPTADVPTDSDLYYEGNTLKSGMGAVLGLKWPAAVMEGTKGDKALNKLPNDTRSPWFDIQVPYFAGLKLQTTDQIEDSEGHRLVISSVEHTSHGYRLTAGYMEA